MKNYKLLYFVLMPLLFGSCSIEPKEIIYGNDACHFCKMTIVDKQHASEIVTKKGKAFKFDAIECMMNYCEDIDQNDLELYLVNDYNSPGKLIDAESSTYLISKAISSPMGAFLSGFDEYEKAEKTQQLKGGKLYSWTELQQKFSEQSN